MDCFLAILESSRSSRNTVLNLMVSPRRRTNFGSVTAAIWIISLGSGRNSSDEAFTRVVVIFLLTKDRHAILDVGRMSYASQQRAR